jgi:hypothetical protein
MLKKDLSFPRYLYTYILWSGVPDIWSSFNYQDILHLHEHEHSYRLRVNARTVDVYILTSRTSCRILRDCNSKYLLSSGYLTPLSNAHITM